MAILNVEQLRLKLRLKTINKISHQTTLEVANIQGSLRVSMNSFKQVNIAICLSVQRSLATCDAI